MFLEIEKTNGSKAIININQIVLFDAPNLFMTNGHEYEVGTTSEYEIKQIMFPKKYTKVDKGPDNDLLELFEDLHKLTGGKGKAVFSFNREKKLKELLGKHRMTEVLLRRAATNIGNDAFLQGDNDAKKRYGDIDYLLRPDKAAKWAEEINKKKKGMF